MPLTALHATAGTLDLSAPALGAVVWEDVYRVRPRAPLSCRECGHGVHSKVSRRGLRFFAHDARSPNCSLSGETMAHRLLKMELATAIRSAGWHAELEVPGNGWRADVLATSKDGQTRMAWEAQLASTTADALAERTATMAADGVGVCWVSDKDTPWMGHVPSIRVRTTETSEMSDGGSALAVVAGLGVFHTSWCSHRRRCDNARVPTGRHPGPCAGHGYWDQHPDTLQLHRFVQHVLHGTVKELRTTSILLTGFGRHDLGPHVWTTRPHWLNEQAQLAAVATRETWVAEQLPHWEAAEKERADHLAAIANLLARQAALRPLAIALVARETGGYVGVRDPDPTWAMGVPLFVQDTPQAVISPVAGRIEHSLRQRLADLTIVVASQQERERLTKVCVPGQRFEQFEIETIGPPSPAPARRALSARRHALPLPTPVT